MTITIQAPEPPAVFVAVDQHLAATSSRPSDGELVATLLAEGLRLLDKDLAAARRCLESARLLVRGTTNTERPKKCCLTEWQARRAKDFIRNNLGTNLKIELVAKIVHLSAGYFSRAFRSATGFTYSEFVAKARVDRAKSLLLTSDMPISEVALVCGFADQSHLTRIFSQIVGLPPNAWRRQLLRSDTATARHSDSFHQQGA